MRLSTALFSTTALIAASVATSATADITTDDVWANTQAYLNAFGGVTTGELSVDRATTTVSAMTTTFAFPFGFGTASLSIDAFEMRDNGDGSVLVVYPDGTSMSFAVDIPGQFDLSATMTLNDGAMEMLAQGDPGDITYDYNIPAYSLEIGDLTLGGALMDAPDAAIFKDAVISGTISMTDNVGSMRVVEGNLIETTVEGSYSGVTYDFTFDAGAMSGFQKGTAGAAESIIRMALPAGGLSVMAIPAALKAGMAIEMSTDAAAGTSEQEISLGGEVLSYSRDKTGPASGTFSLDEARMRLAVAVDGYEFDTLDPSLPIPIKGQLGSANFELDLPMSGSDKPQSFVYNFGAAGIELDEALWSLVDPAGGLPRDPATIGMDLSGRMGTTMDMLDIPAWIALDQSGEVPFSIHSATLENLFVSAVGAELSGAGDFTFNMDDLDTFDGLPAPTGAIDLKIVGANGLIDKLIDLGLVASDEAMGARMMLGIFARPGEGEDTLTSKIEIDGESGSIMANGQRIQ